VSIEANPATHKLLERNLSLNGFGTAVHCALTTQAGEVDLFVPRSGGDVYSSIRRGGLIRGEDIECFRVPGRTLDEVVASQGLKQLDAVKIDIEGAELDVLKSAPRLMSEFRPLILCEYGTNTWPPFGANKEDLLRLLRRYNYTVGIFTVKEKRVRAVDDQVWNSSYANLVLQPTERVEVALIAKI
jgi:FkbM family methyltransferase